MRQPVATERAPLPAAPFSQAIINDGVAYISGQGSFSPQTNDFVPGSFREQAEQTFRNLGAILEACGSDFEHVLKVSVFLHDRADFAELNAIYASFFKEPYPARTTVQAVLPRDGMLIEVDCIAAVPTFRA